MQTSRFLYWGAQVGGWSAYGILIFLATYADNPTKLNFDLFISLSLFLLCGIAVTHLMRNIFIKLGLLNMKLAPLIPRIILFSIITATIMAFLNHFVTVFIEKDTSLVILSLSFLINIMSLSLLIILWNAIYFTYHFFGKSIKQELEVLKIEASQNEIELKSLRSQINPHFLFNSLNSIRALIDIEPKSAKESVTKLSNLLRKSLVQGKNAYISVSEEIELVKNYLDLEKIRFEERLDVFWYVDENVLTKEIPPFIIHTQVENAIKHGISKLIKGGRIEININENDGNYLQIIIKNTGKIVEKNQDMLHSETGIGIENTKRRLDLQYKGKANFNLYEEEGNVFCCIEIKD
ncbi:MAG: histidine kinase [Bacteroidota bacterium]